MYIVSHSNSCHLTQEAIRSMLQATPVQGKSQLEPLKTFAKEHNLPINILEDHQVTNTAEKHEHEHDLWICLEGEATFTLGGEGVEAEKHATKPFEWKAKTISNGTDIVLKPGELLFIPAGDWHSHKTTGTARLWIIKLTAKLPA